MAPVEKAKKKERNKERSKPVPVASHALRGKEDFPGLYCEYNATPSVARRGRQSCTSREYTFAKSSRRSTVNSSERTQSRSPPTGGAGRGI